MACNIMIQSKAVYIHKENTESFDIYKVNL